MNTTQYLIEVKIANQKPVQVEVFADTNGSMNSGNPALRKAVEDKIASIFPKKVVIIDRKILKKF